MVQKKYKNIGRHISISVRVLRDADCTSARTKDRKQHVIVRSFASWVQGSWLQVADSVLWLLLNFRVLQVSMPFPTETITIRLSGPSNLFDSSLDPTRALKET